MNKKKIGMITVIMVAAVGVILSVPAFAQGPERFNRNAGWDNNRGTEVLVGSFLGAFLAYTIQNNQHHDRDRYYPDRDRDRYGQWDRDYRYNGPNHRRYEDRRSSRYDQDRRYGPQSWDHDRNR
jgi:hypothetical protein